MKGASVPVLLLAMLLWGCFATHDISTTNMVSLYRSSEQLFHPEFSFYNVNDSLSKLYVRVKSDEFLYVRQPDDNFLATVRIKCNLIRSYDDTKVLDTASAEFMFSLAEKKGPKIVSINVPNHVSGDYLLHVFIIDGNKGFKDDFFIPIEKPKISARNDFMVLEKNNDPAFRLTFSATDTFKLIHNSSAKIICKYYHRDFPLPPPPFSFNIHDEFNYHPDSIFTLEQKDTLALNLRGEGFYHFQIDTTLRTGFTVFRFSPGFPVVSSPQHMLESLRFLTNKKEFEDMKKEPSVKTAVDNFWLTRGSRNEEKTRDLIKKYYGRIQEANKYFTSYTEGWRTDRGMIYVIFGSPTTVNRSETTESWVYGTANSPLSVNFLFLKVNNPFTANDFTLSRSPIYESNWYRAVEVWRQGRAFNSFY